MIKVDLPYSKIMVCEDINNGVFDIADAVHIENLPKFKRIVLHSKPSDRSFIVSEIWLPEDWNGIYIGLGNGGMGGAVQHGALAEYLRFGYAASNTNLGTSRGVIYGVNNPDVWKDYGWRATYLMTVCAKLIIKEHYGRLPDYSYFHGQSTGGQQAICMAQRFPKEYNGIFAGVHANNRTHLHTYFLWNYICSHSAKGEPLFLKEDALKIYDLAVEFHQLRNDGVKGDDFVSLPLTSKDDITAFVDFVAEKCPDYTNEQLEALLKIYTGPVNPVTKKQIYCGMPIGSEIYHCGLIEAINEYVPHYYPFNWVFGMDFKPEEFDFNEDMDRLNSALATDVNANNPDLIEFYKNGGKLLAVSGSGDSCVPFQDALNYYARVKKYLGADVTDSFYRYYVMPGKEHGVRGRGTNVFWQTENGGDVIQILRSWVEKSIAPDSLYAIGYNNGNSEEGIKFKRQVFPVDSPKGSLFTESVKTTPLCDDEFLNI